MQQKNQFDSLELIKKILKNLSRLRATKSSEAAQKLRLSW